MRVLSALLLSLAVPCGALAQTVDGLQADAAAMLDLVEHNYAYPERVPEGWADHHAGLRNAIGQIKSRRDLLGFAETALHRLCDHHAITGPSSTDSAALVPSFTDLWVEEADGSFRITQVRRASPAAAAGLMPGDDLVAVGGVSTGDAVAAFWDGEPPRGDACAGYAARVLAAGPRQGERRLTVQRDGQAITVEIDGLYTRGIERPDGPLSVQDIGPQLRHIVFNDSLGDAATIAAFDAAVSEAPAGTRFIIDLRETPSGGNTSVGRAVLGHFTEAVAPYQRHALPVEARESGVQRSWIEEVSPRQPVFADERRAVVLVGRWTGSMGEGMAVGFDALGVDVMGSPMAGLLGAIGDYRLEETGWIFKLPFERLSHVDGTPREAFTPPLRIEPGFAGDANNDPALAAAVDWLSQG